MWCSGLAKEELVLLTHGDSVECDEVAEDFEVIAKSGSLVAGLCLICSVYAMCLCVHCVSSCVCMRACLRGSIAEWLEHC